MNTFFNYIKSAFNYLKTADRHQRIVLLLGLIFFTVFNTVLGVFGSILLSALVGLLYELTYAFVPFKEKIIFGKTIKLPDYRGFVNSVDIVTLTDNKKFNSKNVYFCFGGILLGVIFKLIFVIF